MDFIKSTTNLSRVKSILSLPLGILLLLSIASKKVTKNVSRSIVEQLFRSVVMVRSVVSPFARSLAK